MYLYLSPCFFSIYFWFYYLPSIIILLYLSSYYYLTVSSLSHSFSFLSFEPCAFWHPCVYSFFFSFSFQTHEKENLIHWWPCYRCPSLVISLEGSQNAIFSFIPLKTIFVYNEKLYRCIQIQV